MPHLAAAFTMQSSGLARTVLDQYRRSAPGKMVKTTMAHYKNCKKARNRHGSKTEYPHCLELLLSLAAQQSLQDLGIAYGIAAAVVIEIGKHLPVLGLPLVNTLRPPLHIGIGIGTRIEVLGVRAMKAHINKVCRRSQNAG